MISDEVPLPEHDYAIPIVLYGFYETVYPANHAALVIQPASQYDFFRQNP